jgi:hypothetical protein
MIITNVGRDMRNRFDLGLDSSCTEIAHTLTKPLLLFVSLPEAHHGFRLLLGRIVLKFYLLEPVKLLNW